MSKYLKDEKGNIVHRNFNVEGELYYGAWIPVDESSHRDTIQAFLESSDWTWYEEYYEVKYVSYTCSTDKREVDIKVRPMNAKELTKARR